MKLHTQTPYKLSQLIELLYELNEDDTLFLNDLWLFTSDENDDKLNADTIVYLDEPNYISIEQEEIEHEDYFSDFVKQNNLWNCYFGDQFEDVLLHYKENTSELNIDLLIKGLNYYNEYDDFYSY